MMLKRNAPKAKSPGLLGRLRMTGAALVAAVSTATLVVGCLDRPVVKQSPHTSNVFVAEMEGDGLLFPLVDQVVECRNNKLLWAGTLDEWENELDDDDDSDGLDNRGRLEALSHCYTVIVKPAAESNVTLPKVAASGVP